MRRQPNHQTGAHLRERGSDPPQAPAGDGRRGFLVGAAVGASATMATWVAPQVLSAPARAAGSVTCPDPTNTTRVTGTNLQRLVPGTAPFVSPNNNTLNNNPVLRSATLTNIWFERQLTVTSGVAVNRTTPNVGGFNGGSSGQNTTLAASPSAPRTYCSYFVHGDRQPDSASLTGSVTFPVGWRIAALIYQRTQLQNSHAFYSPALVCTCSPSGVTCCYHPMESTDTMNWTRAGGQDTLTWTMTFGAERDQIRVLLEPTP